MHHGFHHQHESKGHHHPSHGLFAARGGHWGWGERGGGHFDGHGEKRRHRMFDRDGLRLILLKLISDSPRHGYDLIRAIEERTRGTYAPSPGVVYPLLTLLGDMELVEEGVNQGTRRVFSATQAGLDHLTERADEVVAIFAQLDALGERASRTSAGPISRAMTNLHMVLRARAEQEEQQSVIHDIAEILDEAARKIERL